MLSLYSAAAAFAPVGAPASSCRVVMQERSAAIPFLKKPPALDGTMAGDKGFDPLGFTTTITELGGDLNYVREAELMHGRQSMLATVGFIFPAIFGKIAGGQFDGVSVNPLEAQYQLSDDVFWQLVFAISIAEGLRAQKVYSDSPPGEHGFDPLGFLQSKWCDTPEKLADMKEKEISHCRLAMIGVTGMWAQTVVTGHLYPFY